MRGKRFDKKLLSNRKVFFLSLAIRAVYVRADLTISIVILSFNLLRVQSVEAGWQMSNGGWCLVSRKKNQKSVGYFLPNREALICSVS